MDDIRRAADVVGRMRAMVTKAEPARIDFDADEAIREVMALTERERERSGVKTRAELGPAPALLHGDRVQFQQVMINLVLNAVEAMRETPQDERLLLIQSRPGPGWLDFRVEDRGPGVEADRQSQIFESLFTTKVGGTGLGLAISKSIVESHGGVNRRGGGGAAGGGVPGAPAAPARAVAEA
ncbi:MAG: ATP-binding protein [Caulobacteraceae bacterium]